MLTNSQAKPKYAMTLLSAERIIGFQMKSNRRTVGTESLQYVWKVMTAVTATLCRKLYTGIGGSYWSTICRCEH